MQEINVKYNNLKNFVKSVDETNEWVIYLQSVPFESFHLTVKQKVSNGLSIDDIYKDIVNTSKIVPEKITDDIQKKLHRYIEYFTQIAQIM